MIGAGVFASPQGQCQVMPNCASSSLLNHTFMMSWCWVHNMRESGVPFTHLAFQHDDIESDSGWVDTLVAEMGRVGADMISAYAPIKDDRGVVSMATYQDDIWDFNRFTIRQLAEMPETFTQDEVSGSLLLNTGCCVLRLRGPWVANPERFVFRDEQRMVRNQDGQWTAAVLSEDWLFSDQICKAGGKLAATRKVGLSHEGTHQYRNNTIWGRWEVDKFYAQRHGESNESQIPARLQVSAERQVAVANV